MLIQMRVRDLAIVSRLELELGAGLWALTGETGAGKSILVDALGLVLGERADATVVRTGCGRTEVEALFELARVPAALDWLAEHDLTDDEAPGTCLIRRSIPIEGRSRAFVNGRSVTGAQLRELGDLLVDIHGQHAHQSLLKANAQRSLLDAYGGHLDLALAVAEAHHDLRGIERRLNALETAGAERQERQDLLRFQVDELEGLRLSLEEWESLDLEQRRLSNLGRLQSGAAQVFGLLSESEPALEDQLRAAAAEIAALAEIDAGLREALELIEGAAIHAREAAVSLRHYLDGLELDPAALDAVETRIAQVHDLARKYRVFPQALPDLLETRRMELAELDSADQSLEGLRASRDAALAVYRERTRSLSAARAEAAERLGTAVTDAMQHLGMVGGHFTVLIDPLPPESANAAGVERVEFQVSANPGQPLAPLARVASGGELSRISLGLQVATAACGSVPTLVFDEVDVGIGGAVAEIVGRLLRDLGASRQVLCVTHLPQVAAQAHHQLRVRKETSEGATHARIDPLAGDSRVEEIARMLGGTEITARTLDHAREMLEWHFR
jgi:DNA repair protein RecN (Recombination protein N)